jgi:Domain of unknown function (DUF4145)
MIISEKMNWNLIQELSSYKFTCGYCGSLVGSAKGWGGVATVSGAAKRCGVIRVCPHCSGPTYVDVINSGQIPGVPYGNVVKHLPSEIEQLYEEASSCMAGGAPTAAALCCRKLLMHIAVERKAEEGKTFQHYVDYLETDHYIPTGAKGWVDQIRTKGNEANHEIKINTRQEGEEIVDFTEMLLKVIYEYPSRGRAAP